MEEQLTLEQLPQVLRDKLRDITEKHPTVIALRRKMDKCQRNRDYLGMAQARADLARIQTAVEENYLRENSVVRKRLASFRNGMTDEEQERMSINANMVILLTDMIESCCIEINEIVGRHQPEYRVEMFDDVIRLGNACAQQIKWMAKETDMFYQISFGDAADNISLMVRNKVKSLLRKIYKHNREKKGA